MRFKFRLLFFSGLLAGSLTSAVFILRASSAQQTSSIAAKHISISMPVEREYLGRQLIGDLERCYEFMNAAANGSLRQKVVINVDWGQQESSCNRNQASITIGMNQPAAAADGKGFLYHSAAREIARLALIELSQGGEREDTKFLFEGMIEILVHEFDRSSRSLEAAWAFSHYLDEMQLLGLTAQRSWSSFSGGKHCLRNASPGITFLTTFRELQGRERPMKLFESLKKNGLLASLSLTFKAPVADIENIWLKRVREYRIAEEITAKAETAPRLLRTVLVPDTARPGETLQLRLFIEDRALNLLSNGIFIRDARTGRFLPVQEATEKEVGFFAAKISVDANCPPGQFNYEATVIDESGNLRHWSGSYTVGSGR